MLSHPTCHRNHWAMKYCRRAHCVCPWDLTSEAKACACSLQGIKSTCSTARGLTEINMNIATTCADSGLFITHTQETRQKAFTCDANSSKYDSIDSRGVTPGQGVSVWFAACGVSSTSTWHKHTPWKVCLNPPASYFY